MSVFSNALQIALNNMHNVKIPAHLLRDHKNPTGTGLRKSIIRKIIIT